MLNRSEKEMKAWGDLFRQIQDSGEIKKKEKSNGRKKEKPISKTK